MICTPYATEEYTYVLVPCNTSFLFKLNMHFPVNFTPFLFIRRFDIFKNKKTKQKSTSRTVISPGFSKQWYTCMQPCRFIGQGYCSIRIHISYILPKFSSHFLIVRPWIKINYFLKNEHVCMYELEIQN